jgi:uncharacterized protein
MNRHLLDVNVLLALLWPRHGDHGAAHDWFMRTGRRAWATNTLTQLGALRLLTNPAITQGAMSARGALEAVLEATAYEGHEFWPLGRDFTASLKPCSAIVRGHRQWTDAVLLRHALERNGVLVTFDGGIKALAEQLPGTRVLLLKRA